MIAVGIVGGAGYTGGEALRILLNHPQASVRFVSSASAAGRPVAEIHRDLIGETDLRFCAQEEEGSVDLLILCGSHGQSKELLAARAGKHAGKIIDLSQDFRLRDSKNGDDGDGSGHGFTYGLPELLRERIRQSDKVANPGCFATAIQLGLLPLAASGVLPKEVHVTAITGSTGAGQKASETTHFSWRSQNLSVYKAFEHQHLAEIKQNLRLAQGSFDGEVHLVPMRGNFARGILASMHLRTDWSEAQAFEAYLDYYAKHPFTHVSEGEGVDLKQALNTNKCLLSVKKHGKHLHVVSVIDNLLKGAAGQAVQNMNLMFGLEETLGLKLKPSAF